MYIFFYLILYCFRIFTFYLYFIYVFYLRKCFSKTCYYLPVHFYYNAICIMFVHPYLCTSVLHSVTYKSWERIKVSFFFFWQVHISAGERLMDGFAGQILKPESPFTNHVQNSFLDLIQPVSFICWF